MKQLIVVRKDLINQYGFPKMMVQVAHASTKLITDKISKQPVNNGIYPNGYNQHIIDLDEDTYEWINGTYKKIILYVKSEEKLLKIFNEIKSICPSVLIQDMALTVYPEPTYTCIGLMGADEQMNGISQKYHLQLLK